jgi:voltage-gated potassium channel
MASGIDLAARRNPSVVRESPRARFDRFLLTLLMPALLVALGTAGYNAIEGWSLFDSLYMTVITLTTVGYREVHPLSRAGQVFTMLLALGGIFMLFFAATSVLSAIVRGDLIEFLGSRRVQRSLAEMKNHVIVCGFGRMGRLVCQQLAGQRVPFVAIDRREELFETFDCAYGVPLHGDATSDEVLDRAGVHRARALISVVASDADNLYITMSSRLLNDQLFIVARAEDERSEEKLLRAGANRVVSPYVIGGTRVADAVLRPNVVDFLELATRSEHLELNIEEARISPQSDLAGLTLAQSEFEKQGLIIVAIKQASGRMLFNPTKDTVLAGGDVLIMLGRRQDLDRAARRALV